MTTTPTPPCANWRIWVGNEVEGTKALGVKTLFIRSLNAKPTDDFSVLLRTGCSRVWFCKEFTDWNLIKALTPLFKEACIEVEPKCYDSIPKVLRETCRIYLKVPVKLKAGDFVCVGPAFSDESFEMGTGAKVSVLDYLGDRKLL